MTDNPESRSKGRYVAYYMATYELVMGHLIQKSTQDALTGPTLEQCPRLKNGAGTGAGWEGGFCVGLSGEVA